MQLDLSLLMGILGGGSLFILSIYCIFIQFSGANISMNNQNDVKKTQNNKNRKKKKNGQVSVNAYTSKNEDHVDDDEKFSAEKITDFLKNSDFSFEQVQKLVNLLLKQVPRESWAQVIPINSQSPSHVLSLAEKDSEISKLKIEAHSLQARLENAEDELRFSFKAAKGVEESFKGRISKLESEIERLEGTLTKSSGEYARLESELRIKLNFATKSEQEAKQAESRLRADKANLVKQLKEAESYNGHEVAAAKEKLILVIQEEITATNRRLVSAENTAETLRRQLETTDGSNLAQMSEQLAEKLALTETKVTQLTSAVAELTNEKQRVEAVLEEKTRALSAARQAMEQFAEGQSSAEFDKLTRDCELLMVRLAEAQGEVARLKRAREEQVNGNGSSILDGLASSGL